MRSVALLEAFANKKVQKCITLILSGTDSYISVKFDINKLIRVKFSLSRANEANVSRIACSSEGRRRSYERALRTG